MFCTPRMTFKAPSVLEPGTSLLSTMGVLNTCYYLTPTAEGQMIPTKDPPGSMGKKSLGFLSLRPSKWEILAQVLDSSLAGDMAWDSGRASASSQASQLNFSQQYPS